ncbi:hypothetical protein EVAR_22230_1 [Eumeta japonica]|uniref:Uncharacterized protein n=1 Tax=Eumeta variegata TaxID=151549 RepID=A0A4C1UAG5_EUMVA|nr:hypothetical protein EVAR_22230_1 [Eumeta japonica]
MAVNGRADKGGMMSKAEWRQYGRHWQRIKTHDEQAVGNDGDGWRISDKEIWRQRHMAVKVGMAADARAEDARRQRMAEGLGHAWQCMTKQSMMQAGGNGGMAGGAGGGLAAAAEDRNGTETAEKMATVAILVLVDRKEVVLKKKKIDQQILFTLQETTKNSFAYVMIALKICLGVYA